MERKIPADPGNPESHEIVEPQAGHLVLLSQGDFCLLLIWGFIVFVAFWVMFYVGPY